MLYRRTDEDRLTDERGQLTGIAQLLLEPVLRGTLACVNAFGTGVADDKLVHAYVEEMVRFYLGEEPILSNVPTWRCDRADDFKYVIERLSELVVKEIHGSGGKGMLVGPTSSKVEIEEFTAILKSRPDIDQARIGLIGHSEGGTIAPLVASQTPDAAFIVIMTAAT